MKKITYVIFLSFICYHTNGQAPTKTLIRSLYKKAATDEGACKEIITTLESYNENNNVLWAGYKAYATIMLANHVFNPYSKLSNFNAGKKLLENCINADKGNVELRLLRFAIQTNAPSFLGYSNSINEDKLILINILGYIKENELKQQIISFLKTCEQLTPAEKLKLNQ